MYATIESAMTLNGEQKPSVTRDFRLLCRPHDAEHSTDERHF